MKTNSFTAILVASTVLICSCNTTPSATATIENDSTSKNMYGEFATQEALGKHLVIITGCNDCHTPKKMTDHGPVNDETLELSGAQANMPLPDIKTPGVAATYDETAWVGPWGKSFAANLTSDSTGIGLWSEGQFIECIRKGISKGIAGSRPLMPPMPWQEYGQMSDKELKAIFAYLKSTKPIHNIVTAYQPQAAH